MLAFARGDLEASSADSEKALQHARRTKDPQLLAPALAVRATVLAAQGQREQASRLASEVLARGAVLVPALVELHPTMTPVEFAWLTRDLGCPAELLSALKPAPSTPWLEAARAIARGGVARGAELAASIGAPSVAAYARLRAAEALARTRRRAEPRELLAPAVDFFTKVGATRYLTLAEEILARTA